MVVVWSLSSTEKWHIRRPKPGKLAGRIMKFMFEIPIKFRRKKNQDEIFKIIEKTRFWNSKRFLFPICFHPNLESWCAWKSQLNLTKLQIFTCENDKNSIQWWEFESFRLFFGINFRKLRLISTFAFCFLLFGRSAREEENRYRTFHHQLTTHDWQQIQL